MDIEKIKEQARHILDKFASALEKVEKEAKAGEEGYVEREEFERKEGIVSSEQESSESSKNVEFRQAFLKNAPQKDDDFIIAERGDWK